MNNRVIKFRVWGKQENKFVTHDEYIGSYNGLSYTPLFKVHRREIMHDCFSEKVEEVEEYYEKYFRENYIAQQFTGLTDLNGKEVYEGDLVNIINRGVTHGPEAEYLKNCEIHWSEDNAAWEIGKFHSPGIGYWGGYSFSNDRLDKDTLEVVGNIFENPDFAKDQKIDNINGYLDA